MVESDKVYLVTFILLIKYSNCELEGYIVGGEYADIRYFPHAVFLAVSCDGEWICGSSILNQRLLLTAAHCLEGCGGKFTVDAYAGHENLRKVTVLRKVRRFAIHEQYDQTSVANDIAVVFLKQTLPLGSKIKRVIISKYFPSDTTGRVAGWGIINDETEEDSPYMKTVAQKLTSLQICSKYIRVKPGMICAVSTKENNRPSDGDSGSGLVTSKHHLMGLVSFRRKARKDLVVYSNVSYFYPWIRVASKMLYCRGRRK